MIMKKLVITFVIALTMGDIMAQDLFFGYFQTDHMYLLNPAEVVNGHEQIFLEYGRKWSELASPPEVFQLGGVIHSSQKLSFGGILNRYSSGILNRYHFGISTGYNVNLTENQTFSAGINTYLKNNSIVINNVIADLNDPVLTGGQYNKTNFGLGIGLSYTYDYFKVHLSMPETHDVGDGGFTPLVTGGVSYDFYLNDFQVAPYLTYFGTSIDKVVEGLVMVSWRNTVKMGAGYRSNNTLGIRIEFQSGSIALGYAIANNDVNFAGAGVSNNFSVRYLFNRKKIDTNEKINSIISTNERILGRLDAEKDSARIIQEEILLKLDALTNQQNAVHKLQANFLEKFEEADRKNTVDEATNEELEPGYYLVIYSFHDSTELKKIKEELISLPFETRLIHDKEKSYYYISTRRYDTLEMAVLAMQNIRNQGFEEAWIHWYK